MAKLINFECLKIVRHAFPSVNGKCNLLVTEEQNVALLSRSKIAANDRLWGEQTVNLISVRPGCNGGVTANSPGIFRFSSPYQ